MAGRLATLIVAMAVLILARVLERRLRGRRHSQALQTLKEVVHHLWWTYEVDRDVREDQQMQRWGML